MSRVTKAAKGPTLIPVSVREVLVAPGREPRWTERSALVVNAGELRVTISETSAATAEWVCDALEAREGGDVSLGFTVNGAAALRHVERTEALAAEKYRKVRQPLQAEGGCGPRRPTA